MLVVVAAVLSCKDVYAYINRGDSVIAVWTGGTVRRVRSCIGMIRSGR
jgi:hypothetical protein